ncbi:putative histone-lysine N-methyltransferase 2D-like 2, partial [Homarus americanus]
MRKGEKVDGALKVTVYEETKDVNGIEGIYEAIVATVLLNGGAASVLNSGNGIDGRPLVHVRPPRTHANRPVVITRRAKIIGYHNAGERIREIVLLMGIFKETARRWVGRYEAEGNVETRPGQPRVTTAEEDERLIQDAGRTPQKL